jgi:hypothetical protein
VKEVAREVREVGKTLKEAGESSNEACDEERASLGREQEVGNASKKARSEDRDVSGRYGASPSSSRRIPSSSSASLDVWITREGGLNPGSSANSPSRRRSIA